MAALAMYPLHTLLRLTWNIDHGETGRLVDGEYLWEKRAGYKFALLGWAIANH